MQTLIGLGGSFDNGKDSLWGQGHTYIVCVNDSSHWEV